MIRVKTTEANAFASHLPRLNADVSTMRKTMVLTMYPTLGKDPDVECKPDGDADDKHDGLSVFACPERPQQFSCRLALFEEEDDRCYRHHDGKEIRERAWSDRIADCRSVDERCAVGVEPGEYQNDAGQDLIDGHRNLDAPCRARRAGYLVLPWHAGTSRRMKGLVFSQRGERQGCVPQLVEYRDTGSRHALPEFTPMGIGMFAAIRSQHQDEMTVSLVAGPHAHGDLQEGIEHLRRRPAGKGPDIDMKNHRVGAGF